VSAAASPRCAIVTGTTSGIGAEVAAQLLRREWTVIGIARRSSTVTDDRYEHLRLDLADASRLEQIAEADLAPTLHDPKWTRIALVNNAASPALLGPVQALDPCALLELYAVNLAAPAWLMGFVSRHCPITCPLRIVNVSSAAGVHAFPGLGAYGSAKAGLRIAGMVLAEEWGSDAPHAPRRTNAAIVSYEPGIVDTAMQDVARSQSAEQFPWVGMFTDFVTHRRLVPPRLPAAEIVSILESDPAQRFSERRL
jgi:benzil reductase ((S)-benzoin forming)